MKRKNKIFMLSIVFVSLMFVGFFDVFAVEYTKVSSAEELKAAIANGESVQLIADFELSESIKMTSHDITLDLNGHTITGKDTNTKGNFNLFEVFKGKFNVVDSVGTGKITLEATTDRDWNAMSNIIEDHTSVVTISGGAFEHLGGTDMAYVVNVNANSYGDTTLNVNGGSLYSTYTAIRLFMSKAGTSYLNITAGDIDGVTSGIWAQAPESKDGQKGQIRISGGNIGVINTARSTLAVVDTVISGGTVASVKSEVGELKITGGHIEGDFIILTSAGEEVLSDKIITGGSFGTDASVYLADGYSIGLIDDKYVAGIAKKITITEVENAEVSVAKNIAIAGEVVTVNVIPVKNYEVSSIEVLDADSKKVTVENNKFVMPDTDVTVKVNLVEVSYEVDVKPVDSTSKVDTVTVGVKESNELENVLLDSLNESLKDENNQELATVLANSSAKVTVDVADLDNKSIDGSVVKEMEKLAKDAKIASYFDISVLVKNKNNDSIVGTVANLTKEIELMILLPKDLKNTNKKMDRNYFIIREHDGKIEKIPATLSKDGNSLVFKSNKFSTYALAYEDIVNPKTYDGIGLYVIFTSLSLGVLASAGLYIKRKRFN